MLDIQIEPDAEHAARAAAADIVAHAALAAVSTRGRGVVGLSGGHSVASFLTALGRAHLPWSDLDVVQVDERDVSDDSEDRNARTQRAALVALPEDRFHGPALHVGDDDLDEVAAAYDAVIGRFGPIDCVHLGLGSDGHTASLVPDDPVLEVRGRRSAATVEPYQGHRRITLTYDALDEARAIVWLVTGSDKAAVLARLVAGDRSIPGGRVRADRAIVVCDQDAAIDLGTMPKA